MKISTKFIGSSAVVVGLIAVVLGGSTFLRNQAEESAHRQLEQANRAIELALELDTDLADETNKIKDNVLLKDQDSDIKKYQTKFLADLKELERLMPEAEEIKLIRRRHQFLVRLATQLTDPIPTASKNYLADSQQDFRAINHFDRDIDFFLTDLSGRVRQQKLSVEREFAQLQQISQMVSYGIVIVILLLYVTQLLNQVFMNIINNAINALEEGVGNGEWGVGGVGGVGDKREIATITPSSPSSPSSPPTPYSLLPTPQILIRTELTSNNRVVVRIADNGLGMTQEVKRKLFDIMSG